MTSGLRAATRKKIKDAVKDDTDLCALFTPLVPMLSEESDPSFAQLVADPPRFAAVVSLAVV